MTIRLSPGQKMAYFFMRIFSLIPGCRFRSYRLYRLDRSCLIENMPASYTVCETDRETIRKLCEDSDWHINSDAIDWRLKEGATCLLARINGEAMGLVWIKNGHWREDEMPLDFHLPPEASWDMALYIPKKHRNSRAIQALIAQMAVWMDANNCTVSFSHILSYNLPSIALHNRLGARQVGLCLSLKISGMCLTMTHLCSSWPVFRFSSKRIAIDLYKRSG